MLCPSSRISEIESLRSGRKRWGPGLSMGTHPGGFRSRQELWHPPWMSLASLERTLSEELGRGSRQGRASPQLTSLSLHVFQVVPEPRRAGSEGLKCVPQIDTLKSQTPRPGNVTSCGDEVFANVINVKSYELRWALVQRTSLVAQTVKNPPAVQETKVRPLGQEDPLEKETATHSSTLAWRIPRTEEPGGLQSMGLQGVGHDWATSTFTFTRPVWLMSSSWEIKGHRHRDEDYVRRRQKLEWCYCRPRNVWGYKMLEGRSLHGGFRGTTALLAPWFWTSRL